VTSFKLELGFDSVDKLVFARICELETMLETGLPPRHQEVIKDLLQLNLYLYDVIVGKKRPNNMIYKKDYPKRLL
jgi:hypothetical protein